MNISKKEDRRVKYTKQAIRESFLELLSEKPIEKISVTEICKKADINRGTFYSHYTDPFELRQQLEQELKDAFAERKASSGLARLPAVENFRILKENQDLCGVFYGPNGDNKAMYNIIYEYSFGYVEELFGGTPPIPETHTECLRSILVSATNTMLRFWYENGMKEDPALMAEALQSFCDTGAKNFVQKVQSFT